MTPNRNFQPTRWSLVANASSPDQPRASRALEKLCKDYWYPVYAAIRRAGHNHENAEDLTQIFFIKAIEKDTFSKAREEKGRFRTFILACLKYFLIDEHDRATAAKRDGRKLVLFDSLSAQDRYAAEGVDHLTPDQLFERALALEILKKSEDELGEGFRQRGKYDLFLEILPSLYEADDTEPQAQLADRLSMTPAALTSLLFRTREDHRELLRARADQLVTHPEDGKDELIQLQKAI